MVLNLKPKPLETYVNTVQLEEQKPLIIDDEKCSLNNDNDNNDKEKFVWDDTDDNYFCIQPFEEYFSFSVAFIYIEATDSIWMCIEPYGIAWDTHAKKDSELIGNIIFSPEVVKYMHSKFRNIVFISPLALNLSDGNTNVISEILNNLLKNHGVYYKNNCKHKTPLPAVVRELEPETNHVYFDFRLP